MAGLGTGAPIVKVYHERSMILPDVSRVLACLYEKEIPFERETFSSYSSLLKLQASSRVPVPFYDGPNKFLEESREICHHIAETYEDQGYPFLLGKDSLERASIEEWLHHEEHNFNPPSRSLFCHLAFPVVDDIDLQTRKLEEVLEVYEQRLGDSQFLAGNKFTLADLVHLPNSHHITNSDKFLYLYDSRKNVQRWWHEISRRGSWKKVLKIMHEVELQNEQELDKQRQRKQEELEKQQRRQWQKQHPPTSRPQFRLDPREQPSTKPHTILVPPPVSIIPASPTTPQAEEPHAIKTSPDEAPVSSSLSIPTTHKPSDVRSKHTTISTTHEETPPAFVQSTPRIPDKSPIPVERRINFFTPATSPTTAEKPSRTGADKSRIRDASLHSEAAEIDLPTKSKPSSSKKASDNLHDFYEASRHTDKAEPYAESTSPKPSEMLDEKSETDGHKNAVDHAESSPRSAKEDSDRLRASGFWTDNRAPNADTQDKKSVRYTERIPQRPVGNISGRATDQRVTYTSPGKPRSSEAHQKLQSEQWHATAGLSNLKGETDDLIPPTQQAKPSKDVQDISSQDSEPASTRPLAQEPVSMDAQLAEGPERATRTPDTDQRRDVSSMLWQQGAAVRPPYARKDAAEARRFPADRRKDASLPKRLRDDTRAIPLYDDDDDDDDDTNQEARETASAPRRTRAQDPYDASEGTSSRSQPVSAPHDAVPPPKQATSEGPYARKDAVEARRFRADHRKDTPLPKRVRDDIQAIPLYDDDDTNQEARETASAPRRTRARDPYDTSEGISSRSQPVNAPHDAVLPPKQETPEGPYAREDVVEARRFPADRGKDAPLPKRVRGDTQAIPLYDDDDDTNQETRETASAPRRTRAGDPYDTSEGISSRSQPANAPHDAVPQTKQTTPEGPYARKDVVESRRFPADRKKDAPLPKRVRDDTQAIPLYGDDHDSNQETRETASAPRRTRAQDPYDTSEGIGIYHSSSSRPEPVNAPHDPVPLPNQAASEGSRRATAPYPAAQEVFKQARKSPASRSIVPHDAQRSTEEETMESSSSKAHPLDSHLADAHPPKQYLDEDGYGAITPLQTGYTGDPYNRKQDRGVAAPKRMMSQDDFEETKMTDSASLEAQTPDHRQADAPPQRQQPTEDPQTSASPSRIRYSDDEDTAKQAKHAHQKLQSEQWHAATTGLSNLKGETDDFVPPTQQAKPSKDVQHISPQDAEQANTRPLAQEPVGMDGQLVQGPERTARTPHTDQRRDVNSMLWQRPANVQGIAESDRTSSDHGGAVRPPYARKDAAEARIVPADRRKDASFPKHAPNDTQAVPLYEDDHDTSQEARETASAPRRTTAPQDPVPPPKQAAFEGPRRATTPYPAAREIIKQARKSPASRSIVPHDAQGSTEEEETLEETEFVEPASSRAQPVDYKRTDTPSRKREGVKDPLGATSPVERKYADGKDTTKHSAFKPRNVVGQDAEDTSEEAEARNSALFRRPSPDSWSAAATPSKEAAAEDALRVSQSPPTRYPRAEETSKASASIPTDIAAQDARDVFRGSKVAASTPLQNKYPDAKDAAKKSKVTFEETKISDSAPSRGKPLDSQRVDGPSWKKEATEDPRATSPVKKRRSDVEDTTKQSRDNGFKPRQIVGQHAQGTYKETKASDPVLYTWQAATTPTEKIATEDGPSVTPPSKRRSPSDEDSIKQSRGTAPAPRRTTSHDANVTFQDSKPAESMSSGEQPLRSRQEVEDSRSKTSAFDKTIPYVEDSTSQALDTVFGPNQPADSRSPTKVERTPSVYEQDHLVAQDSHKQPETLPTSGRADGSILKHQQDPVVPSIPEEKSSTPSTLPRARIRDDHPTEEPFKGDNVDDRKGAPPLLGQEPASQVQRATELPQEAAPDGELSTIDQWRRTSVPLQGDDVLGGSTIDQKPPPMSEQSIPSARGANEMVKKEKRMVPPARTGAQTPDVQRAPSSFSGADTAERDGEQVQMQAPTLHARPTSVPTRIATPDARDTSDQEFANKSDAQRWNALKAKHDLAMTGEDYRNASPSTHDATVDNKTALPASEAQGSDTWPGSTANPVNAQPTSDDARVGRFSRDQGAQPPESTQAQTHFDAPRASVSTPDVPRDTLDKTKSSKQTSTEGMTPTAATPTSKAQFAKQKFAPSDKKLARAAPESSKEDTSFSAPEKPQTIFRQEARPSAAITKQVPSPDAHHDTRKIQHVTLANFPPDDSPIPDQDSIQSAQQSSSSGTSKETIVAAAGPTLPATVGKDTQGSRRPIKAERTPSVYQEDRLVAQDSHEQPQTLPIVGKADGSTPKRQQDPEEKSSTPPAPPRARVRDGHTTEEPFKGGIVDDRKRAPPLLGQEPTSQVQRATERSQEAAPDGELSTIDKWQRTSVPLQGDDVLGGSTIEQRPTPMSQQSIPGARGASEVVEKEQRMAPPARPGAQTPNVLSAPSSFSAADTAERDGEPVQMQAPTLHDQGAKPPESTQAQSPFDAPYDSVSTRDVPTDALDKTNVSKPTSTEGKAPAPTSKAQLAGEKFAPSDKKLARAARPTSTEGMAPIAGPAPTSQAQLSEQKFTPSDKKPEKPQTIFRQEVRPSTSITKQVPSSDAHHDTRKIQQVNLDNFPIDDSSMPQAPEPGTKDSPASNTQIAKARVQETVPDNYRTDELTVPSVSNEEQGSYAGSSTEPHEGSSPDAHGAADDEEITKYPSRQAPVLEYRTAADSYVRPTSVSEVFPAIKKSAPSDQDSIQSAKQPSPAETKKEETIVAAAEWGITPTPDKQRIPDLRGAVDEKTSLQSNQAQNTDIMPDSAPIGGDVHRISGDEPATSSVRDSQARPPAGTQKVPAGFMEKTKSRRPPSTDQESMASPAPAPAPDAPQDQDSDRSSQFSPSVVSRKDVANADQTNVSQAGLRELPSSNAKLPSEEIQESSPDAYLTKSEKPLPMKDPVWPPHEASFDLSSGGKPTMIKGDQASTISDVSPSAHKEGGQSEDSAVKGPLSAELVSSSPEEKWNRQQQTDQSSTRSSKDNNIEASGTRNPSTSIIPRNIQPSPLKESMQVVEGSRNQQQGDQAVFQSKQDNKTQTEETDARDTASDKPEVVRPDSAPTSGDAHHTSGDGPATSSLRRSPITDQELVTPLTSPAPAPDAPQDEDSTPPQLPPVVSRRDIANTDQNDVSPAGLRETARSVATPPSEKIQEFSPDASLTKSAKPLLPMTGTYPVQPLHEASVDLSSDGKPTMIKGDQANTISNVSLSTSQAVGQSENSAVKGPPSDDSVSSSPQKNLERTSPKEKPKQQRQSSTRPSKDDSIEASATASPNILTTSGDIQSSPLNQPSPIRENIQAAEMFRNQQQADQDVLQPRQDNRKRIEETEAQDTSTDYPEDTNGASQRAALEQQQGKNVGRVQRQSNDTNNSYEPTKDASSIIQADNKPESSSRTPEEPKQQVQREGKNQDGEAKVPASKTAQPEESPNKKGITNQSQSETIDKLEDQTSSATPNRYTNPSRSDGSTSGTKSTDTNDNDPLL